MTIEQIKTAYTEGATVYFVPLTVYDYLDWKRADMPGAPFASTTRIPGGIVNQITNNLVVVEGELVDDWTVSVSGQTMQLNRLYVSKDALKTALKSALLTKVDEATAIAARDAGYANSVDEIGIPVLAVSVEALDCETAIIELAFDITNTGEGELDWTITTSTGKVSVDPNAGDTLAETDTITVTVDRAGMEPGMYEPTVDIVSDGGNAQIVLTVIVEE